MCKTFAILITCYTTTFLFPAHGQEKVVGPVRVKIQEEKQQVFEPVLPIDPQTRVEYQAQGGFNLNVTVERRMLHLGSIYTVFKIDDQVQAGPGKIESQNVRLPKTPAGKQRDGVYSIASFNKIRVKQTVEVVPTKTPGSKQRRRDAVLVRYTIENTDTVPHRVGMRKFMDVYVVDNDGAVFAANNQPGKILDGVDLKDKLIPDYLQMLQHPNLQNPGFVGYQTYTLGKSVDRPDRIVLTNLGAMRGQWDVQAMPAMGDSAMAVFWEAKEIKAKGKREIAFAIGGGIASDLESEGVVKVELGGSFEPGKLFTVNAYVSDPAQGQSLTLELPAGMERIEGKETQPVPAMDAEGNCMVQWKARVVRLGQYTVRLHSSTGVTQTRTITISPAE